MLKRTMFSLLAIFLVLSACNLPQTATPTADGSFLVFTQQAQTVESRLTELAATNTPSQVGTLPPAVPTPVETAVTPEPTTSPSTQVAATPVVCDSAKFITDVTVTDGTEYDPGTAFTKTWRLMNSGSCTWTTAYAIVFDKGNLMSASSPVNLTASVAPGDTVDISINMIAPLTNGKYAGYWKLRNASGTIFGLGAEAKPYYVSIKVGNSTKVPVIALHNGQAALLVRFPAPALTVMSAGLSSKRITHNLKPVRWKTRLLYWSVRKTWITVISPGNTPRSK
jgi:hypothetical protein